MALPSTFRKLVVTKLTQNFREAITTKVVPMSKPGPHEVLVRNRFVGINASDVNKTAGRYEDILNLKTETINDIGFESVGNIVDVGSEVKHLKLGQNVCFLQAGAYAEYTVVNSKFVIPVPTVKPDYLGLLVSGMTADLSLREMGKLKKGETVLVTAAAGGTGQFAVQYAKLAGCHVLGTCSSDSKAQFLKDIGCDRPINHKTENLHEVLKKEYPRGVDVVYECIGGDMFKTCLKNLAVKGRLILIGFVSGYHKDRMEAPTPGLLTVLGKSLTIAGFFLLQYLSQFPESLSRQASLLESGAVRVQLDQGRNSASGPFRGIESVADALDYLYSSKSIGKVFVEMNEEFPNQRM